MSSERADAQSQRDRTRTAILDAAEARLRPGDGLSSLNVNEIAEAAGVARPTFYTYFEDRHALMLAMAERRTNAMIGIVVPVIEHERPTRAMVGDAIAEVVELWRAHAPVLTAVIKLAERDERLGSYWTWFTSEIARVIATLFELRRSELYPDVEPTGGDPAMTAYSLVHMAEGSLVNLLGESGSIDDGRAIAEAITEIVWSTASAPPPGQDGSGPSVPT